ncbi:hypothetical protein HS088_TW04G00781 [Tripterygium wilfordii]|uniref:E3 ubiquitin protein ligase n=1 Tax=Tripterygium wilfordii TaxID=458696 RepID=A0A7J7DR73_TRIWF|nr:hypothetical protein HS088_TW04G00781 [Tripterygium wilfordii]
MFLCRLLEANSIESFGNDGIVEYVEESLTSRHSSTMELMKFLEETINVQRKKTENIAQALFGKLSAEDELKDDKHVRSSRLYSLVTDQLQHWNAEVERYKAQTDSLQGRKDIKEEFRVMASALSKEMEMMEAQLKRWKQTAHEAVFLRDEAQSLKSLLGEKVNEQKCLADRCEKQMMEIKSLKILIEEMQKEKLELQIILDMYGKEGSDNRDLLEIKESERRAHSQAEVLRDALDEHSLELRVKAANEAEAACEQRLSATEAEIAELRAKLGCF